MAYDNITALPGWLSNGLCGLSTGTGFSIRSLGTDDDEIIFVAQRPIMINGISDFVDRADLGDRSYFLHLPRISWSMRRTEEAFWADFDRDCPLILGGLLDAVSELPKSAQALSVKLRQLAPQLRSIGIEVEFQRETTSRFVTIAMTEENGASAPNHKSPLVGARLRAFIEIQNRNARSSDQSRNSARPTQRDERMTRAGNL